MRRCLFNLLIVLLVALPFVDQNAFAGPSPLRFKEETLVFSIPRGLTLTAKIRSPIPAQEFAGKKFPLLLIFGGFEEAARVLDFVRPKVSVVLASFDYPYTPPRKFEFPSSLKYAPEAKQAIQDMIDGIRELHTALKQKSGVDALRTIVVGASFGAPFALAAAAQDPSISGVVLIHGFGDIPGTVRFRILQSWKSRFGPLTNPLAWLLSRLGWLYLDAPTPEVSVLQLKPNQRALMISAREDTIIPRESIESLALALDRSLAQKEKIFMDGDHLHPSSERNQTIEAISDQVIDWMKRVNLR